MLPQTRKAALCYDTSVRLCSLNSTEKSRHLGQALGKVSLAMSNDAYQILAFKLKLHTLVGEAFQVFINELMQYAYPGKFIPTRPYGKIGDQKNDGYLLGEGCLFQVYAPREVKADVMVRKIKEDFDGAVKHWESHLKKWVFIHNDMPGLPPQVNRVILELEHEYPNIEIEVWSHIELEKIFSRLAYEDKVTWLGEGNIEEQKVTFNEIEIVLSQIEIASTPELETELIPVPFGKIEANGLSKEAAYFLKLGFQRTHVVDDFFAKYHDEMYGERLATKFRAKYYEIKDSDIPDAVFAKIQVWVGGKQRNNLKREMAIFVILAYFFERCDIFERPRSTD